jgi:hypothetical protein
MNPQVLLLETDELDVDDVEALVGLNQEVPKQFVHRSGLRPRFGGRLAVPLGSAQCAVKAINFC